MTFIYSCTALVCRVITDDIQIRFFEQSPDGELVWEAYPDVNDLDVHHQVIYL